MHRMRYVDRNLNTGETVVYETRLHWVVMAGHIFLACVLIACGVLIFYFGSQASFAADTSSIANIAGAVMLLLGVIWIFVGAVKRNATEMAVTNHRVIIKVGLVGRRTVEMLLSKIESIEVQETAIGRMLGYGTIVVIGTGGTPEPFDKVAHPLEFRSMVQQQIEQLSANRQ
jgi:uncharacterized membrane protein YdbT with pleckstrin-like domain